MTFYNWKDISFCTLITFFPCAFAFIILLELHQALSMLLVVLSFKFFFVFIVTSMHFCMTLSDVLQLKIRSYS